MNLPNHIIEHILWRAWQGDSAAAIAANVQMPHDDVIAALKEARDRLTLAVPIQEPGKTHFEPHHRWHPKHDAIEMMWQAIDLKREDQSRTYREIAEILGVPYGTLRSYAPKHGVALTDLEMSERNLRATIARRQAASKSDNRQRQVAEAAAALKRADPSITRRQIAERLNVGKGMLAVYLWREGVRLNDLVGRDHEQSRADKSVSVRTRPADTGPNGQRSANSETTPTAGGGIISPASRPAPFTDDEQAAIDAAVLSGKVTRIEQGEWPDEGRADLKTNFFSFVKARKNGTAAARTRHRA